MRVVVLSLADPWAQSHGGTLRTRAIVVALTTAGHEVSVVFPVESPAAVGLHTHLWPADVSVVEVPSATLGNRNWPDWLRQIKRALLPLPTTVGSHSRALSEALRSLAPVDLLVVSVLPFARYANDLPRALRWIDHSDLYSDVLEREAGRRRGVGRFTTRLQRRSAATAEDQLSSTAAISTAAGLGDAAALTRRSGHMVEWLPTPVASRRVPRTGGSRPVAGFLANFSYWPNRDGLELLRDSWAPRLVSMGWDVVVAGLASDTVEAGPHIRVLGPVDSPEDFYSEVDVTLAPMRVGGGMKVKVVESLTHGRPVLATTFAVAGFPPEVADLVHVTDHAAGLQVLAAGIPNLPGDTSELLAPFSQAGFNRRVATLLASSSSSSEVGRP